MIKRIVKILDNLDKNRSELLEFLHMTPEEAEIEGRWKVHRFDALVLFTSGDTIYWKDYEDERSAKHAMGRIRNTPKFALNIVGELAKQAIKEGR